MNVSFFRKRERPEATEVYSKPALPRFGNHPARRSTNPPPDPAYTAVMRRLSRALCLIVVFTVAGACSGQKPPHATPAPQPAQPAAPPPAPAGDTTPSLPLHLDDEAFWSLIDQLSEPGGSFRSDNLLSNELFMQYVIPELTRTAKPGRVYMGVGPEQNFTYIAAIRPAMVFILDVRRGNMDLQLLYKALFELSHDRAEFVARLFSRPRPEGLAREASINDIFEAIDGEETSEAIFAADLRDVMDHLTKARHLPLLDEDVAGIQYVYRAFQMYGPGLTYWSTGGFGGRMGRTAPTYWDLMLLTDESQVNWSYLANDANFLFVKSLEEQNLIVPVVGNFGGDKALKAIAAYLKQRHATVSAFYLSNVEQYLYGDGLWEAFCGNVAMLPLDESSTFIRSVRSGQFGYGPGGLSSVLGNMLEDTKTCRGSVAPERKELPIPNAQLPD
jgi:hypothetical protein